MHLFQHRVDFITGKIKMQSTKTIIPQINYFTTAIYIKTCYLYTYCQMKQTLSSDYYSHLVRTLLLITKASLHKYTHFEDEYKIFSSFLLLEGCNVSHHSLQNLCQLPEPETDSCISIILESSTQLCRESWREALHVRRKK